MLVPMVEKAVFSVADFWRTNCKTNEDRPYCPRHRATHRIMYFPALCFSRCFVI